MSTPINDGGSAFPNFKTNADTGSVEICPQGGMTLRDYFAAKALQAILSSGDAEISKIARHKPPAANLAKSCYIIADAMLEAREAKL